MASVAQLSQIACVRCRTRPDDASASWTVGHLARVRAAGGSNALTDDELELAFVLPLRGAGWVVIGHDGTVPVLACPACVTSDERAAQLAADATLNARLEDVLLDMLGDLESEESEDMRDHVRALLRASAQVSAQAADALSSSEGSSA